MCEHLREKGWEDNAYIYGPDEPGQDDLSFNTVKEDMQYLKQVAPNVKRLVAFGYPRYILSPDEEGWIDIWVPLRQNRLYTKQFKEERRRKGESAWWYVVDEFSMTETLYSMRSLFWDVWQTESEGFLYYATAFYEWEPHPSIEDIEEDGTLKKSFLPAHEDGRRTRCSFHLVYPAGKKAEDGIAASVRLEAIRDGIEDWEYLYQLKEVISKFEKEGKKSSLIEQAKTLMREIDNGKYDDIRQVRKSVAEMLERLHFN
jgi:hypothetical protein